MFTICVDWAHDLGSPRGDVQLSQAAVMMAPRSGGARKVTALRLVVRHDGDHRAISAVEAPLDLDRAPDLDDALRLGTSDLVHLAVLAISEGWTLTDLEVADQWMLSWDDQDLQEITDTLRGLLRRRDEAGANAYLNDEASSVYIRWVQFRDQQAGGGMLLDRNGTLEVPGKAREESVTRFMAFLSAHLDGLANG